MTTVLTVLKSHGEFRPEHVLALREQVARGLPEARFVALSDVDIEDIERIPLKYPQWHNWWAKMEMFRPDIHGDFLYMDLDTVIGGNLKDIAAVDKLTVLRDFYRTGEVDPEKKYRPEGLGSGLMFVPEADRKEVWDLWMTQPHIWMHIPGGDQSFLEKLWMKKAQRWQDIVPGQIISYKKDVRSNKEQVPDGTKIVAFHGRPRPWKLPVTHTLYKTAGYAKWQS